MHRLLSELHGLRSAKEFRMHKARKKWRERPCNAAGAPRAPPLKSSLEDLLAWLPVAEDSGAQKAWRVEHPNIPGSEFMVRDWVHASCVLDLL